MGFNWYEENHPHHVFARLAPIGPERDSWAQLSRVGKLAWYWNALNTAVMTQFDQIPSTQWKIVKLEDLTFAIYQEIMQFLDWPSQISPDTYQQVVQKRPGKLQRKYSIQQWSPKEIAEFEEQVRPFAHQVDYPYIFNQLPKNQDKSQKQHSNYFWQSKANSVKIWLYQLMKTRSN